MRPPKGTRAPDDEGDEPAGLLATLDDDALAARYHLPLAAALVRGRLGAHDGESDAAALRRGAAAGVRLHKFKTQATLPRVRRVIGLLRALQPASLLDVGSGRGTFLWPLLAALPDVPVVALDHAARRATDLGCVARGGIATLRALRADAARLPFGDGAFDVVTLLEVLEHLPDPAAAARAAVRVARRHLVVSVPSHEDDNPEHLHLFAAADLEALLREAGARRVTVEHVLNHAIAVATLERR